MIFVVIFVCFYCSNLRQKPGAAMTNKEIITQHHATFEGARHVDEDGNEFWLARDLAPLFEYQDWRNFVQVVEKAKVVCQQSAQAIDDHFGDLTKMVKIGSGAKRELSDRMHIHQVFSSLSRKQESRSHSHTKQAYIASVRGERIRFAPARE